MAQAIIAAITDVARSKFADMVKTGNSFKVDSFVTGSGGHDPENPTVALTPDPTIVELPNITSDKRSIPETNIVFISPFCVQYQIVLDLLDSVGPLSNIGLYATGSLSETFLFAVANFPLVVKTDAERRSIFVQVNY